MANPTTNYSFAMPQNSDLVKDLPADFEVFGQAVDTQMKTNADLVIPKTIVDAKGDLIVATAADTVSRLAVGTNGQALIADSTAATGVKWDTPAAGGMTLISTTSLTGAATINITSIPSTYNNLQLVIQNYKPSTDGDYINVRVNNDSNTRYRAIASTGLPASNAGFSSTNWETLFRNDNSVAQGLNIIDFPNYANTTTWKMGTYYGVNNHPTTTSNFEANVWYLFYNQTSAISQINLFTNSASNFTSGTALLYGVK
jgi:hypothetical protein